MENWGTKELYDVIIKTTYPMVIGGKSFEAGEPIFIFDTIQMSDLTEMQRTYPVQGGIGNNELLYWKDVGDVDFKLTQGTISAFGLALLSNLNISNANSSQKCDYLEHLGGSPEGTMLKYEPITLFVYSNGAKLQRVSTVAELTNGTYYLDGKIIYTSSLQNLEVYYTFQAESAKHIINFSENMFNGYLSLTGKLRLRDSENHGYATAVLEIPKLRLTSNLTIRVGKDIGYPEAYTFGIKGIQDRSTKIALTIFDNEI